MPRGWRRRWRRWCTASRATTRRSPLQASSSTGPAARGTGSCCAAPCSPWVSRSSAASPATSSSSCRTATSAWCRRGSTRTWRVFSHGRPGRSAGRSTPRPCWRRRGRPGSSRWKRGTACPCSAGASRWRATMHSHSATPGCSTPGAGSAARSASSRRWTTSRRMRMRTRCTSPAGIRSCTPRSLPPRGGSRRRSGVAPGVEPSCTGNAADTWCWANA